MLLVQWYIVAVFNDSARLHRVFFLSIFSSKMAEISKRFFWRMLRKVVVISNELGSLVFLAKKENVWLKKQMKFSQILEQPFHTGPLLLVFSEAKLFYELGELSSAYIQKNIICFYILQTFYIFFCHFICVSCCPFFVSLYP